MIYTYTCNNKTCLKKEGAIYRLEIPSEAIMDEKNIAKLFCRKCGAGLTIEQKPVEKK